MCLLTGFLHSYVGLSIKYPRLFSCILVFRIMVLVSFIPRTYNSQQAGNMLKTSSVGSSHSSVILSYLIETVAILTLVLLSQAVTMARSSAFPWQRSLALSSLSITHTIFARDDCILYNRNGVWRNLFRVGPMSISRTSNGNAGLP